MKKNNRTLLLGGVVLLGLFVLAVVMDIKNANAPVTRKEYGMGDETLAYRISAEGIMENDFYQLTIKQQKPTEEMATEMFGLAKEEIRQTFFQEGESANRVTKSVHMKEVYANGAVKAEWFLSDYTFLDPDGLVQEKAFEKESGKEEAVNGHLMNASVLLSYEEYREEYVFGFCVYPAQKTKKEQLLDGIEKALENTMAQKGTASVELPSEVDGTTIIWKKQKDYLAWKVLLLELGVLALLPLWRKEKLRKEQKERRQRLQMEYPEMVQKMAILMGAGMSVKQAWYNISARYLDKRNKKHIKENPLYEEMLRTKRELEDGKSERQAYQEFGERTGLQCYFRLARLLVMNLSKGTRQLGEQLFAETELAFEERKRMAQKLGEEASTKLLLPLMLMMGVVMAIIITPAIIEFKM